MPEQKKVMVDLAGYISEKQIESMLTKAKCRRDYVLMLLAWRSGRRISEILLLKKSDIDFEKALIKWNILKKRKPYQTLKPIDNHTNSELYDFCKNIDPDTYVFSSPYKPEHQLTRQQAYNIIRNAAEDAGIFAVGTKTMHPHVFRHSFAIHIITNLKNDSMAIIILKKILEHSSLNDTSTYLQFGQSDIRDELNRIFGGKNNESNR